MQTPQRELLLSPNMGSRVKVERYVFSLSTLLDLGLESPIGPNCRPSVTMRLQELRSNAPVTDFVFLSNLLIGNINANIGEGLLDAHTPGGGSIPLDLPTITPANTVSLIGHYTGRIPEGYEPKRRVYVSAPSPLESNSLRAAVGGELRRRILKGIGKQTQSLPRGYITIDEHRNSSKFLFSASFTGPASVVF